MQDKHLSSMERSAVIKEVVKTWSRLQFDVNALIDSSRVPNRGTLKRPGIRQLLEKKEGLFRMHMMGKRVNYSARSVISPDPNIETNEIGIPPVFATRLTFPEPVTTFNIKDLRKAVINGPNSWPGATHVQHEDGSLTVLERLSHESRVALANQLLTMQDPSVTTGGNGVFAPATMGVNKKVYRHIRNGDMLLVNRQPTLHKPSIMAHRAVVLPGEKTIRMHYANCNTYNADFDGDEMNLHYPQNELARAEAALIAITDKQYLVPTSGDPLRGLIQDHVVMGTMMTKKDTFFSREDYQHLLYSALRPEFDRVGDEEHNIVTVPPTIWRPKPLWTGKQVITSIILNLTYGLTPPNLKSQSKVPAKSWSPNSEEGQVLVVHGELLMGVLDKSQFGASGYGLIHTLYELYGPSYAGQMLSILGRLFTFYSQMRAYTCRMDDLLLTPEGDRQRREVLKSSAQCGAEAAVEYLGMNSMVKDPMHMSVKERHDFHIRMEEVLRDDLKLRGLDTVSKNKVAGLTSQVNNICIPGGLIRPFPANHMQAMTVSGAKGSDVNARQISGLLGQQDLEGRRVPVMVSGKTLPSFRPFDTAPRANGFVGDRFLTGIRPQEFYFHCMAGRDGLIDTAVKTANSGYLQRCLIKHMEGIRVEYDHTVRDADGSLIQFYYGEDALDVTKQKHLYQFGFAASNYAALKEKYQPKQALKALDLDKAHDLAKKGLRKPEKYPPVMSLLSPSRYLGSTSEKFLQKLKEYIGLNPDRLLWEDSHGKKPKPAKGLLGAMVDPECNKRTFHALMELQYMHSLADPGESVGLLAAQGVGEPSTQMTLNTFHLAGFGDKNVTLGIPRLREIVMTASVKPKTPNMTLPLLPGVTTEQVKKLCQTATRLSIAEVLDRIDVYESAGRSATGGLNQRVKKYTLHLQFYPAEEYEKEYGITSLQLEKSIAYQFLPHLKTSLTRLRKAWSAHDLSNFFEMDAKKTSRVGDHDNGGDLDETNDGNDEEAGNDRKASAKSSKKRGVMDDVDLGESDDSDAGDDGAMDEEDGDRKQVERRMARQRAFANADEEGDQSNSSSESEEDEEDAEIKPESTMETPKPNSTAPYTTATNSRWENAIITQNQKLTAQIVQALPWLVRYEFDRKHGEWCKIELEFPAETPKLLMVDLAEKAAHKAVVNEVPHIKRCFQLLKEGGNDYSDELATDGVNFSGFWDFADVIDVDRITSNDIYGILTTYGVEAARASIMTEISEVFERYHITVDPRHISLIADYMTFEGGYKPFNRLGLRSSPMPFAKMSFETTCTFLKTACLHGDYDQLSNPSSRIVVGKPIQGGTGAFDILHNLG
ncbi:hypothetical protein IWQ62_002058 [Dispira parvispora]|uniref:DNA-directed RNA polymerase I subunit RPA1 n=1 Tax=Dispira parvispora TaxID=1520584 RepID=A0A9W8AR33_9FUNG|nr:hypothetical protein IWQ62_002058 [Dispira parvispora]